MVESSQSDIFKHIQPAPINSNHPNNPNNPNYHHYFESTAPHQATYNFNNNLNNNAYFPHSQQLSSHNSHSVSLAFGIVCVGKNLQKIVAKIALFSSFSFLFFSDLPFLVSAIITSGLAGVYFEKVLKDSKSSIWLLNIQLSLLSCIFSMVNTNANKKMKKRRKEE